MQTPARTPVRARIRQPERAPISTYENAIWRLVLICADEILDDAAYELAVTLVAEIFGRTDVCVRRDVRKAALQIDPDWRVL